MLLSLGLALFTMIAPSVRSIRQVPGALGWLGTLYFALIGLGFMFVEIGIIQRVSLFLGHPVYGMAIGLFGIIVSTGIGSLASEACGWIQHRGCWDGAASYLCSLFY